jgi:hypothetical protein
MQLHCILLAVQLLANIRVGKLFLHYSLEKFVPFSIRIPRLMKKPSLLISDLLRARNYFFFHSGS